MYLGLHECIIPLSNIVMGIVFGKEVAKDENTNLRAAGGKNEDEW